MAPPPPTRCLPTIGAGAGAAAVPVDISHKAVVLRCVQAMCEDGQLLVDLFVNYDCDLEVRGGARCRSPGCVCMLAQPLR